MKEHSNPALSIHACDHCHQLRHAGELTEIVCESPRWECRDRESCVERREERLRQFDAAWDSMLRMAGGEA